MTISRRKFLLGAGLAGGGLILGLYLGGEDDPIPGTLEGSFQPNAWLQITADGRAIFHLHKAEMGQGVLTALPVLLGEELDYDPRRFEIVMAGVHPAYTSPPVGTQITGGSSSVSGSWEPLRQAGAAARAMLMAAAAHRWGVDSADCASDDGTVINTLSGERLDYGQLANAAPDFQDTPYSLKPAADYRWIGTDFPRLDARAKSTGAALFGIDVTLPGMKTAVIVRCPHYGGSLRDWKPDSVTGRPGVVAAFAVHTGIAIVANTYWQARSAATHLAVSWDKGPLAGLDSATIHTRMAETLATGEPRMAVEEGDLDTPADPARTVSATYSVPHTHHSPMEPQNATALVTLTEDGPRCELWAPSQGPDLCRAIAAHFGDIPHHRIQVHSTLMGGGFGRRGYADYAGEVAAIARQLPGTPVKLIWSREDDMAHDYYRPASLHRLEASLDEDGNLHHWHHTLVAASILRGLAVSLMAVMLPTWVPTAMARSLGRKTGNTFAGFDPSKVDGAIIPYQVPNKAVGHLEYDPGIPVGFWRSVGQSFNGFVVESFVDELAHRAGADPLEFRLRHLASEPRCRAVLELAAARANWGSGPAGTGQGIAVGQPFGTWCAMVAQVSVNGDSFRVEKVVAAVDCGRVITPDIAASQIEGGIIYGLSATLKAPVTFADGAAVESNFHDLPVLRMDETPEIEVHFIDSDQDPTGLGEIGVPAIAPAVASALFAATGKRLRELPLRL